ncbi:MAG: acireductone synthase [Terracidiphilus sp.]
MKAVAPRLYLLDVEGTVAPLSLVTEQLFPFARAHFSDFFQEHHADSGVQADLQELAEENRTETASDCPAFSQFESWKRAIPYLLWMMDRDRKSTALKSLQGRVWKAGFESDQLKGTLFADVPEAFARWSAKGQAAIYSSGSVAAQMLLFRHSIYGDLTPLISGYFDTRTGPKTASASYAAIAAAMGDDTGSVLFFSDVVRELDAAREAGCQTRLVVREGNPQVENAHEHRSIESFVGV